MRRIEERKKERRANFTQCRCLAVEDGRQEEESIKDALDRIAPDLIGTSGQERDNQVEMLRIRGEAEDVCNQRLKELPRAVEDLRKWRDQLSLGECLFGTATYYRVAVANDHELQQALECF